MASDIIERWKASAQRQLCLPLLPFTHARSESINADSLNSNFLQLGRRSSGRPQRAVHPMRLPVNTVIHTTLVGIEPTTFRSLVRHGTSSATEPTFVLKYQTSLTAYKVSYDLLHCVFFLVFPPPYNDKTVVFWHCPFFVKICSGRPIQSVFPVTKTAFMIFSFENDCSSDVSRMYRQRSM